MTSTGRDSPGRGLRGMTRRMSLELKLTALMSVVLATVLTIGLIAVNATISRFAVSRVEDRLFRGTRQLATNVAQGLGSADARYAAAATNGAVRRALRGDAGAHDSVTRVLERLRFPNDSGLAVELWTAHGERLVLVGSDSRPRIGDATTRELPDHIATALDPPIRPGEDSVQLGPLYAEGGRVRFWLVKPVLEGGRPIGYITHQRRIAPSVQAQRTLRELSGDSVSLYYRNADGSLWSTVGGEPFTAYARWDTTSRRALAPDSDLLVFEEERIAGTPLVIGMSVPHRFVVANASRQLQRLMLLALALFATGALATWSIGRSIARPIATVTTAAGEVAAGRYDARVPEEGDPEIRRLAANFNHMAAEVGSSRAALLEQTRRAEAANSAKSEFLTVMSHELRTPLNAIGGYVELLEMELRGPLTEAQRRDLQRIRASQRHLLGLISSVLDLARIESGRVSYDLVNVRIHEFIAELEALVAPQAAARKVTLEHRAGLPDLMVLADQEKLRQIILNLISNAIRHTPAGGRITLSAEPDGSRVAIRVQDTGPGIPPERREEVFEPFVQLDRSLAQSREGLGLGLAISRDLARGMGGDLAVEVNDRTGACFLLTLPHGEPGRRMAEPHTGELPAKTATRA